MSTTAIVIASSAVAMSASNSAKISREETQKCVLFVEGFDSRKSTLVEQKYYASCVQRLNPEPMTPNETTGAKICVAAVLIAFAVGLIFGWKDDGFMGMILWGMMAPLGLVLLGLLLLAIFSGLAFLIGG